MRRLKGKILRVLLTVRVCKKKRDDERIYEKDTKEDLNKFIVKEQILEYYFLEYCTIISMINK